MALLAIATCVPASASAKSFTNAAIVKAAKANKGFIGQCRVFVNEAVLKASGGQTKTNAGLGGYNGAFKKAGGKKVSAKGALAGDIVQVFPNGASDTDLLPKPSSPLHTAIILKNNGDGNFKVIDANFKYDRSVREHSFNPYSFAAKKGFVTIWRLGKVSKPKLLDTDKDGVPNKSDRCPKTKGPKSNKGCPVAKSGGLVVKGVYTPIPGDFNGDGRGDVLWYGPGDTYDALWYGTEQPGAFDDASVTVKGTYSPVSGDFNGDGRTDILWYGPGGAYDALWYGTEQPGAFDDASVTVKGTYAPISGDFNGDGKGDILWYGPGDSFDSMWYGTSTQGEFTVGVNVTVKGTYSPVSGDFNGDGKTDILWYGPGDSFDSMWYGTSTQGEFTVGVNVTVKGTYSPVSGDFNGDGRTDILWYGPGGAYDALWYGTEQPGAFDDASVTVKGTYSPVSGDFNGDGKTDILWYGPGPEPDSIWFGQAGLGQFS